jgi:hypothetical protein
LLIEVNVKLVVKKIKMKERKITLILKLSSKHVLYVVVIQNPYQIFINHIDIKMDILVFVMNVIRKKQKILVTIQKLKELKNI